MRWRACSWRGCCMPLGEMAQGRGTRTRAQCGSAGASTSLTARGSALSVSAHFASSSPALVPDARANRVRRTASNSGTHRGTCLLRPGAARRAYRSAGGTASPKEPWFVAAKDAARNTLVVVQGHDHPLLASAALASGPGHWLADAPGRAVRGKVKVRYRQAEPGMRSWCSGWRRQRHCHFRCTASAPLRCGQYVVRLRGRPLPRWAQSSRPGSRPLECRGGGMKRERRLPCAPPVI